jgi:RNA polymerase sigma-70 factor (ECF subfamily)
MYPSKAVCDQYSDRELIRESLRDIDLFSCIYDRYEERLLRYVERMGIMSHEEARDILQEVFVKVWKNLHAVDPKMKFSSWLYRITHNQTISCLRKKKSFGKDRKDTLDDNRLPSQADEDPEELEEQMQRQEAEIHQILNQLPLKYKEVLVLRFFENMSYEAISDVLKIPEGTVATRINRAKKQFQKNAAGHHLTY